MPSQMIRNQIQSCLSCRLLGLSGATTIDPKTNLLELMDDLKVKEGYSFNGSTLRRALKSLVNENFSQCQWDVLTTTTKLKIDERFIVDSDKVTANDFYGMTCCQILQKLLRTATQKFKPKDSSSKKETQDSKRFDN